MRCLALILTAAVAFGFASCSFAAAKGKAKPAKSQADAKSADIDKAITSVYQRVDKNHSGTLSRVEFHRAQDMLPAAIADLERRGVIGHGKPLAKNSAPYVLSGLAGKDISKSNKISQTEFAVYARSMIDEADARLRASAAAKAQAQKNRNNSRSRNTGRRR
jgi:hypothetical protein